jgi:hypothetical protein
VPYNGDGTITLCGLTLPSSTQAWYSCTAL